ncbi:von Willebrand factor D and EGF domain-containing protein-like isoform X1 [Hydra vulgaris]|uniref:von Willebrand factor D and EGF domain-containing protein-like isoform X1 n=2 Tax=Hydra vulgaris TaxID=6087 RepID=A0ABM4BRY7_HYDVU
MAWMGMTIFSSSDNAKGLNDIQTEGTYKWSDNTTALFFNWENKEPTELDGDEDCVETNRDGWNDLNCNATLGFICKKAKNGGNCTGVWNNIWNNGSYCYTYWYYYRLLTWHQSQLACQNYGGSLLSIASQEEYFIILKYISWTDIQFWIGLNDIQTEGKFVWDDNTTSQFFNWRSKAPDNMNISDDCVGMINHYWNDLSCDTYLGYICEVRKDDPCLDYKAIDDFERSTAFKISPTNFSACHQPFSTDWYRFTSSAGGKMPTKAPPPYSCGVRNPVWLNGTEPSAINEIKSLQACVVVDKDTCANKTDVKVIKCLRNSEEYFVYYLQPLPNCSMRYCAGSEKKCEPEESSLTSFTPCSSPCLVYKTIDDFQRSTAFKVVSNGLLPCDKDGFSTAWYRFISGAGGKIPTKNPPSYSCGVRYPVWLNGIEPSVVGEIKSLEACAVVDENPCAIKTNVKVKKCFQSNEDFFVYYLQPLPSCPMRYCAGSEKKCDPEEVSPTGFTPCPKNFPKIEKDPAVTVGVKNKRIRFICKFHTVKESNARYEVTWFQGPVETQIKGPEIFTSDQNEAFLQNTNKYGENGTFCMGYNIYCKVRSYYIENKEIKSRHRKSNEFFAGFQINPMLLVLSEKESPVNITVRSTVPIVCQDGTENCRVLIEMGQTTTDHFVDYCTLQFKPGPAGQTKEVEVVAKRDFVDDGNQRMFLKMFIPDHIDPMDWNCYKQISDVEIKTIDVKTARCTSSGDPHFRTFDQFYYSHYYVGDYVLVQSTARNFKVHARTFACSQSVSCNCGVAAQEGDDVIVIDMCRDNVPRARFASTVEPQSGTSLTRDNNGKTFMISFPSGAFIKFTTHYWRNHFANIEIQVPPDDFKKTQGLCGTFDNDQYNDMMAKDGKIYSIGAGWFAKQEFSESWKLNTSEENLFYFRGGPKKCTATRAKTYCVCSEYCCGSQRKVNCDFEGYVDRPKYINGMLGWKTLEFPGGKHCGRRKRRSMDDNIIVLPDDGSTGVYDYNPVQVSGNFTSFPTASGITENQAKEVCKNRIRNSTAGKACLDVIGPSFLTDSYEQQCVIDIQVTDSESMGVESAINNLISACEELTLRNMSFWRSADGNISSPPSIIAESICPNECNANGKCKNGTCICNAGFITADCSMKEGQSPVLYGIPNSGLCDIRDKDCIRTRVIGKDFIDSSSLSCRMTEVNISEQPFEKIGKPLDIQGQLLSFAEISCLLPKAPVNVKYSSIQPGKPVGGYLISVSNNNLNFSDKESLFLVYDSKCMECNITDTTCKWKDNSCKINEYCFATNDPNPKQWCEVCNPDKSRTSFSERTNNVAPWFRKNTPMLYAFKGQQWKYEIPAYDPENQPLTFKFEGESHGMKISTAGILTWNPNRIGNFCFAVKVTDPCGLPAFSQFEVETKQCGCEGKNGGFCIWQGEPGNINSSICQCPNGCTGELCTKPIDGLICRIKIKNEDKKKLGGLSDTTLAIIIVLSILFVAICFASAYKFLFKKNKILIEQSTGTNVFSDDSECKSGILMNNIKSCDKSYDNEAFVKSEVSSIEKRKQAWQS